MHLVERLITSARQSLFPHGVSPPIQQACAALLDIFTFGRGVPREINGEKALRIDPTFRFIAETHEPSVCAWVKSRLRPDDIVFDVGAHLGVYSMLAARWVSPGGRVYAFEPNPETVSGLCKHVSLNHLGEVVEVVPAAVGAENGVSPMLVIGVNDQNTLCSRSESLPLACTVEVKVLTLDVFCQERSIKPRLVKMDTEGWELHALTGAVNLLADHAVDFVVELHPYAWASAGYSRNDFQAFLDRQGLVFEPLTGQSDVLGEYGDAWIRRRR